MGKWVVGDSVFVDARRCVRGTVTGIYGRLIEVDVQASDGTVDTRLFNSWDLRRA